eukprot:scaffold5113_cov364-Pinguiococcus_pyrenoidosus.AAC.2
MATETPLPPQCGANVLEMTNGSCGFDVTIVCCSTNAHAEYWQRRLDKSYGAVLRSGSIALAVSEHAWGDGKGGGEGQDPRHREPDGKAQGRRDQRRHLPHRWQGYATGAPPSCREQQQAGGQAAQDAELHGRSAAHQHPGGGHQADRGLRAVPQGPPVGLLGRPGARDIGRPRAERGDGGEADGREADGSCFLGVRANGEPCLRAVVACGHPGQAGPHAVQGGVGGQGPAPLRTHRRQCQWRSSSDREGALSELQLWLPLWLVAAVAVAVAVAVASAVDMETEARAAQLTTRASSGHLRASDRASLDPWDRDASRHLPRLLLDLRNAAGDAAERVQRGAGRAARRQGHRSALVDAHDALEGRIPLDDGEEGGVQRRRTAGLRPRPADAGGAPWWRQRQRHDADFQRGQRGAGLLLVGLWPAQALPQ